MDERLLFEQFHAAYEFEPRPGSFERLRTTLVGASSRPRRRAPTSLEHGFKSHRGLALIAALLAIVIVFTFVVTEQALRNTHHEQVKPPSTHRTPVSAATTVIHSVAIKPGQGGIAIRQPIPFETPIADPCALEAARYGCWGPGAPTFTGSMTGWTSTGSAAPEGPTDLYRTDDAGGHWRVVAGWDYESPESIIGGPSGAELLIVTYWGWQGPAIFHSSDGGSRWVSEGFPLTQSQAAAVSAASVTNCKAPHFLCSRDPAYFPRGEVYFANPREGWVLTQEPDYSTADLFHTTDSGARWQLSARIDVKQQFGLNPPLSSNELAGQLIFRNASDGWFVASPFIYRTTDGGRSWTKQSQPAVPAAEGASIALLKFEMFDERGGVIELSAADSNGDRTFLSRTTDGGATWGAAIQVPSAGGYLETLDFLDAQAWFGRTGNGDFTRTLDSGEHWESLPAEGLPRSGGWGGVGSLDFVDRLHGWSFSGAGLYATSDGGLHWTQVTTPTGS